MAMEISYGLEITELRLGLPGGGSSMEMMKNTKKRVFSEVSSDQNSSTEEEERTVRKSQVVGWPPVCSYRRKNNALMTNKYIKVSMDGAPILRKIDLSTHVRYDDLAKALEKLFGTCYGIVDALKGSDKSEYVPVYEDKDGDWMLVGDVPWEMFIESCKRLRIMKRSEAAKGMDLQPKSFIQGA